MKQKKIVFVSPPGGIVKRKKGHDSQNPEKEEFYYGRRGLAHFIASNIKNKYPEIEVELWRIDANINNKKSRTIKNNIVSVVYPVSTLSRISYSLEFVKDLKKENKKTDLIIWFDGLHHYFFMFVSFFLRKAFQIAHHIGGGNFPYKYSKTKKPRYKIAELIESKLFVKNINLGVFGTRTEFEYFKKYQVTGNSFIGYVTGIDTNRWNIIDRQTARNKIGVAPDEKMILQAGRAFWDKGTHLTIQAWENLLKDKGVKLYITGINENDELYETVVKSGCNYLGIIDNEEFPYWMAAADVYLYPPFDEVTLNFAGIGYAPLEALASGTPIVCTTARFLDYCGIDTDKYSDIIKIPNIVDEIGTMTLELLNRKPEPEKCHEFIVKYFRDDVLLKPIMTNVNSEKHNFFPNA